MLAAAPGPCPPSCPHRQPQLDFSTSARTESLGAWAVPLWALLLSPGPPLHEKGTQTEVGRPGSGSLLASGTTGKREDAHSQCVHGPRSQESPPVPQVPEEGKQTRLASSAPMLAPSQVSNWGTSRKRLCSTRTASRALEAQARRRWGHAPNSFPPQCHPEAQGHFGQLHMAPPGHPAGSARPPQQRGPFIPACSPHTQNALLLTFEACVAWPLGLPATLAPLYPRAPTVGWDCWGHQPQP